jgi:hypothetical protein
MLLVSASGLHEASLGAREEENIGPCRMGQGTRPWMGEENPKRASPFLRVRLQMCDLNMKCRPLEEGYL